MNVLNPDWLRYCKRVVRAGLGSDHLLRPDSRVESVFLGTAYGGWWVAVEPLRQVDQPVVLSFGLGDDISFDREIGAAFGAKVYGFDPTPVSLGWLERAGKPENMEIFAIGIARTDGKQTFSASATDARGNFSSKAKADLTVSCPVMRYESILEMLDLTRPDVLKLDVEGSEYEIVPDILNAAELPTQLLIEFHHRVYGIDVGETLRCVQDIKAAGYELFKVSPGGREMSFILMGASC